MASVGSMPGRGRAGRVQVLELRVLLRGSATVGCTITRATGSVQLLVEVCTHCPLGSLPWSWVVAKSLESWGALATRPGQGGWRRASFSGGWGGHSVRGATIAGATGTSAPIALYGGALLFGSRLGALPPVGGGSQVDVGRVWTWWLQFWCSAQAPLLNEQLQVGIAGPSAHVSANVPGSSVQPHPVHGLYSEQSVPQFKQQVVC